MTKKRLPIAPALLLTAVLAAVVFFLSALSNLNSGEHSRGRDQLEEAVRRSAVACYAAEGIYPPDLAYLEEHYGLQVDRARYTVIYDVFASNLMPDVTVLDNGL
jgi:hypothetical protein